MGQRYRHLLRTYCQELTQKTKKCGHKNGKNIAFVECDIKKIRQSPTSETGMIKMIW